MLNVSVQRHIFGKIPSFVLQDNLHAVEAVDADIADEAYLARAEELDVASTFVEIVGDRDDGGVFDDRAVGLPDGEVDRFRLGEQVFGGCYMYIRQVGAW